MKKLYTKIMSMLCGIGSDKYLHFIVGMLISHLCMVLIKDNMSRIWFALFIPFALDFFKESFIDRAFCWKDLVWTVSGSAIMVGLNLI